VIDNPIETGNPPASETRQRELPHPSLAPPTTPLTRTPVDSLVSRHRLSEAFPSGEGWDEPGALRDALWPDPAQRTILEAVETAVLKLPKVVAGQRKGYSAWSNAYQFAALRPVKGGGAVLGLALSPEASPRLEPPRNEGWSERLKARMRLSSADGVTGEVGELLRRAWELS